MSKIKTQKYELIGIHIQALLENTLKIDRMGLYRDNGFMNPTQKQSSTDRQNMKKNLSIFKSINFRVEITTNSMEVDFLNIIFNLERNTHHMNKKSNDNLSYINTSSNYPSQLINSISANSTKYSNTLKKFVSKSRQIA